MHKSSQRTVKRQSVTANEGHWSQENTGLVNSFEHAQKFPENSETSKCDGSLRKAETSDYLVQTTLLQTVCYFFVLGFETSKTLRVKVSKS